jgi:ABC-type transport system involved in multi-copper enzyme maturation permease subunit
VTAPTHTHLTTDFREHDTMTVTEITPPLDPTPARGGGASGPGRHRAESADLPPVRGQSFLLLVRTELRKSLNTRSGRVLILAILAVAVAGLAWSFFQNDGRATFEDFGGTAAIGVQLLLPVIGVMAMTSEWTQRTALTTFTLSPRRVRVQLAKFTAALVLSVVVLSVVIAMSLGATALSGIVTGDGATYAGLGGMLAGWYLANGLNVIMGAAFGAVLANTAIAIVVFFIAPTVWSLAGPAVFKDNAQWLDVFAAFGRIVARDLQGMLPETLTAIGVWIVLPTIAGLWASSRREVK